MSMQSTIETLLTQSLGPTHLAVINESHQHSGPATESHFKVVIATEQFADKSLIQRHRAINAVLKTQLQNDIHALALHTYTPEEWAKQDQAPESPKCHGGSKTT